VFHLLVLTLIACSCPASPNRQFYTYSHPLSILLRLQSFTTPLFILAVNLLRLPRPSCSLRNQLYSTCSNSCLALSISDPPSSINTPYRYSCFIIRSRDRLYRCPVNLSLTSYMSHSFCSTWLLCSYTFPLGVYCSGGVLWQK
jgi:hypothetical protein